MIRRCREATGRRRKSQRGSSILESALVYSMFLTLLIGMVDVGYIMWVHQSIDERVRAAVRYGVSRAVNADMDTKVRNLVLYNTSTPVSGARPSFGLTASNVAVIRTTGVNERPNQLTVAVNGLTYRFLAPFVPNTVRTARQIKVTLPMETP